MDLIDKIRELAVQIPRQLDHIATEEATKNALVMPFIQALGYNVFDPTEVTPELNADIGIKKGEKVDYAILQDGKAIILIEVKSSKSDLNHVHASQLFRYFTVTEARFGILTNGIQYRFHSDLEKPNKMDEKPFLIFDMLDIDERLVVELKKFTKASFDVENILSSANELKYKREIQQQLDIEYNNPSEEFVRLFTKRVYTGLLKKSVIEDFTEITKQAFRSFINDRITNRLETALKSETSTQETESIEPANTGLIEDVSKVETTQEELDGYYIVKAIVREIVDAERVAIRDVQSYCGILLDDNNRFPICRLHFNRAQKQLGLFNADKSEERVPINNLNDIYKHADRLKATVQNYVSSST